MKYYMILLLAGAMLLSLSPSVGLAQADVENRLSQVESRLDRTESIASNAGDQSVVLWLFAIFSALWAQNTGRNAWLWFFLGLIFSVFTGLFLLYYNSKDRAQHQALT